MRAMQLSCGATSDCSLRTRVYTDLLGHVVTKMVGPPADSEHFVTEEFAPSLCARSVNFPVRHEPAIAVFDG
ncbi:hypothetical protein BDB13_6289 [Rhodococcus sp. OK302]|nr:hypothetical protein BDB13_6289 [Rhodococcus sp. OK302]